jgi:hypothetical protein
MPITTSGASAWDRTGSSSSTYSVAYNVAAGSNIALYVFLASTAGISSATVTYNGVGLTKLSGTKAEVGIHRLVNPSTGSNTLAFASLGNHGSFALGLFAVAVYGVHQTTPERSFVSANGSSTTPTINVTSDVGELVLDIAQTYRGAGGVSMTTGSGQTTLSSVYNETLGGGFATSITKEDGAGTVTMSRSLNTSNGWHIGAVSVKPAEETNASNFLMFM